MMRTIPLLAGTLALATGVLTAEVNAAEVKVLSAGAMRGVLQQLAPAFETASGHKLKIDYATAGVVEQKVTADVISPPKFVTSQPRRRRHILATDRAWVIRHNY